MAGGHRLKRQRRTAAEQRRLLRDPKFRRETRSIIGRELRELAESGVLQKKRVGILILGFQRRDEQREQEVERLLDGLTERQVAALTAYWQRVSAFLQKWGVMHPFSVEVVGGSRRAARHRAILSGRWGLIPVFPWTRAEEVRATMGRIQKVIGRKHRDAKSVKRGAQAEWMRMSGIRRPEIARVLWNRDTGLRRPSGEEAIRRSFGERETQLYRRLRENLHVKLGREPRPAEIDQAVLRALRGSEAPAVAAVRMAEKRYREFLGAKDHVIQSPVEHDPVSYAATMLLRPGLHLRKRPSVKELRSRIKQFYDVLVARPPRP